MTTTHTLYDIGHEWSAPTRIMKLEVFEATEKLPPCVRATYSHTSLGIRNRPECECLRVYEQWTEFMVFYASSPSKDFLNLEQGRRLWNALASQGWRVKS